MCRYEDHELGVGTRAHEVHKLGCGRIAHKVHQGFLQGGGRTGSGVLWQYLLSSWGIIWAVNVPWPSVGFALYKLQNIYLPHNQSKTIYHLKFVTGHKLLVGMRPDS